MSVLRLDKHNRQSSRVNDIATILAQYGFSDIVERLCLNSNEFEASHYCQFTLMDEIEKSSVAERVALVFEKLGFTFIKLGQLLCKHSDLIPAKYVKTFENLKETVKPFSSEEAVEVLETAFDASLNDIFMSFRKEPKSCGVTAQVHHATLKDGTPVVVKIKRPNIEKILEADIEILKRFAKLIDKYYPELRYIHPQQIVGELSKTIKHETNFVMEAVAVSKIFSRVRFSLF